MTDEKKGADQRLTKKMGGEERTQKVEVMERNRKIVIVSGITEAKGVGISWNESRKNNLSETWL